MKVAELTELIQNEVRKAVRAELADLLKEAVLAASTPDTKVAVDTTTVSLHKPKTVANTAAGSTAKSLDRLLEETRLSFTAEDAKSFIAPSQRPMLYNTDSKSAAVAAQLGLNSKLPDVGIDITQLSFVKKAKEVLDLSYEKDKNKGL
jgi:hypothetical protein